jgi:hypothetical protein
MHDFAEASSSIPVAIQSTILLYSLTVGTGDVVSRTFLICSKFTNVALLTAMNEIVG